MSKVKHFLKKWWLLTAIVGIIAVIILFNMTGFRVGPGLSIVRVGTLVIDDLPAGASIYVDEAYNRRTAGGDARITLLPGNHYVIVSVDTAIPWKELVTIESDTETHVAPIIISDPVSAIPVGADVAEATRAEILAIPLPTPQNPLVRENGCALVSVSNNRIIATASTTDTCTPPSYLCTEEGCGQTVILTPGDKINSVLPFPGREDALIISVGQNLFALEIDPRDPLYFGPILRATAPKAMVREDGVILVSTDTKLYEIRL